MLFSNNMFNKSIFFIVTLAVIVLFQTCTAGSTEVCCGDLGCYSAHADFYSFIHRPIRAVPDCRLQSKLYLHLNTIRNPVTTQILDPYQSASIGHSNFNPNHKIKILIHGYLDKHVRPDWQQTTTELLKDGDHNVIRVDWSEANLFPYPQAVANLRLVGAYVARFIQHIVTEHGVNPSDIHIIGHSLGAHGAGYAGAAAQSKYNITIGRITGLDPAGPYFTNMPISVRLDPTDAELVDTVVTNGDILLAFGSPQAMGHINFYPNGGLHQPGCSNGALLSAKWHAHAQTAPQAGPSQATTSFDVLTENTPEESTVERRRRLALETIAVVGCSHVRALALFHEGIANSSCVGKSFQCSNYESYVRGGDECSTCKGQRCSFMGYHADLSLASKNHQKMFYSMTTDHSPFCTKLPLSKVQSAAVKHFNQQA